MTRSGLPIVGSITASDPIEAASPSGLESLHALARLPEDWQQLLESLGERPYRAKQILNWVYQQRELDPQNMTNLSAALRERLKPFIQPLATVDIVKRASDGTRKLLLVFSDKTRVECVLIPMVPKTSWDAPFTEFDDEDDEPSEKQTRVTLCVSTQFGCAMGCVFCESGRAGLRRGLRAEEIVAQVLTAKGYLEPNEVLTNLVFMGMGEPFLNVDNVLAAARRLPDLGITHRRTTISTVGWIPGLKQFVDEIDVPIRLALSVHAADPKLRSRLMPVNDRYPLEDVLELCRTHHELTNRRVYIEYVMLAGVNDAPEQARELAKLLGRTSFKVNLIPYNPTGSYGGSSRDTIAAFKAELDRARVPATVRLTRGQDIAAACGQLATAPRDRAQKAVAG